MRLNVKLHSKEQMGFTLVHLSDNFVPHIQPMGFIISRKILQSKIVLFNDTQLVTHLKENHKHMLGKERFLAPENKSYTILRKDPNMSLTWPRHIVRFETFLEEV